MSIDQCDWPRSCNPLTPQDGDVHVWCISLIATSSDYEDLFSILSPDEQERARRYRFDKDRHRFVSCRGRVRMILASYLDESANLIQFEYSSFGKPSLAGPWADSKLEFNVSNSGEIGLFAISNGRQLGVDIEHIRPLSDLWGFAKRYFAEPECKVLENSDEDQLLLRFFECWTRKEAILKATGNGLQISPERLVVTLGKQPPALVSSSDPRLNCIESWWLHAMQPTSKYVAALALPSGAATINKWQWNI
ncbi:MAG: 4'-phosphopantetheinyl transferase superfamily protein [Gammaproteobacteria bacterium]|nr:4'-phosphopantetheinyl transferase superfamily protein [Gammaproteobacteria bacterium]